MKQFTRTIESFVCENCNTKIKGNGYTNHCSNCLWSKHVDNNPGDRASFCNGMMKPVSFDLKKGVLHRCTVCKFTRYNKIQTEDNYEVILQLSAFH